MAVGGHGERGARAYYGVLGAEPPAGSRGRAPGQGVRGRSRPEAESFLLFALSGKFASFSVFGLGQGLEKYVAKCVRCRRNVYVTVD